MISTESDRLTRLVANLLDLSRIQSGEIEPRAELCTAEELVAAALESVDAPPSAFDVAIDSDLPPIAADEAQLERALVNVIENSLRYAGETPLAIRAHRVGEQLAIGITDRGPGVAQVELERVFEPFYRGAEDGASGRARAGDRAGLRRGQRRQPAPALGAGPGRDLHLPLPGGRGPGDAPANDERAHPSMICDDEAQILRALRVILVTLGFEVIPALTAQEALDAAAVRAPGGGDHRSCAPRR